MDPLEVELETEFSAFRRRQCLGDTLGSYWFYIFAII